MAWGRSSCGKHTHIVYLQQREESCAIACTLMALQRKNRLNAAGMKYRRLEGKKVANKAITEDEVRQASQKHGGGGYYRPSAKDGGAKTNDPRYRLMADMMLATIGSEGTGTGLPNVARTLKALGINAVYRNGMSWPQIVAAARRGVVITAVGWRGGGGHAVLVEKVMTGWVKGRGLLRTRKPVSICVCDPISGARRLALPGNRPPIHRPPGGGAGTFKHEMVVL